MAAAVTSRADASAKLLDVKAVADALDCSPRHVVRLADSGRMPRPVKVGRLIRWRAADIDEWVSRGCPRCDGRAGR